MAKRLFQLFMIRYLADKHMPFGHSLLHYCTAFEMETHFCCFPSFFMGANFFFAQSLFCQTKKITTNIQDLKSSNILLAKPLRSATQEPFAKVADFGLSRTSSHSTGVTREAMTAGVGTWRWMAPEVFENDEGPDDVQRGIW